MSLQADQGARILVIDDEENLRLTFERFLELAGYGEVTGVGTFEAALAAVRQQEFDLIISDIVLEGASGIDFLRQVREDGRRCPVVMITGYPNIETATEAVRLGAFDYLPKPVKKDALLRVAGRALEQWALQKEKERFEEEKERSRYFQETILRSVRELIITLDPDLKVVDMNDMARDWCKAFLPELGAGISLATLAQPVAQALMRDALRVLKDREEVGEHRLEWLRMDGSRGILSVTAARLQDHLGRFLGVVLTARDVTHLEDLGERGRRSSFHRLVGASVAMQRIYALVENVGQVDTTVLITGESGTGKELVAEALHNESPRRSRPLVKVDCTAIPEDLLESELFGHKKGAFTGAERDRLGRILQADGGTLFLDEIGDISARMQLRLLRFLQERTFYPVGRDQPIHVDVRVIAATNADLKQRVRDGAFREDLYFRLRVVDIMLPPLRERQGDIPLLVQHFLQRFNARMDKGISGVSDQALAALEAYSWPGNVRELEHVMERAYVLCPGSTITVEHLLADVVAGAGPAATAGRLAAGAPQGGAAAFPGEEATADDGDEVGRILRALRKAGGNKAKAARLLGIDRSTLYRKILAHNIDTEVDEPLP
ncbi:MAG: sigma 54-interacting transcriptional regulator [Thermodesulfobacteriota bacterium]